MQRVQVVEIRVEASRNLDSLLAAGISRAVYARLSVYGPCLGSHDDTVPKILNSDIQGTLQQDHILVSLSRIQTGCWLPRKPSYPN